MNRILHISPEPETWGTGRQQDVAVVTKNAAMQLWRHCPNTFLNPIVVRHRDDHPKAAFARDEWARIQVWLSAADNFWCKYAYQMAHEFCHVLALHANESAAYWHKSEHANHWLEESLCEMASWFSIRSMSIEWKSDPPYSHWMSYSQSLWDYAQNLINEATIQMPESDKFSDWLKLNEPEMRRNSLAGNPTANREANKIIALMLLPIFERSPNGWESLTFLNLVSRDEHKTLNQQLSDWRSVCPDNLKTLVGEIAVKFKIQI